MSATSHQNKDTAVRDRIRAAGRQALKEAAARRSQRLSPRAREIGGPAAPEPTRYGDWERKGIASDF